MYWHPGKDKVMDENAWIKGGDIPGSLDLGQYLFVRAADMNGDDALDMVVGGRRAGKVDKGRPNDPVVGLRWVKAPAVKSDRRDLSKWKVHPVDTALISGNGFYTKPGIVCKDLDGDGRNDILTTVNKYIYYFHNEGGETPDFNLIKIEKPEYGQWRARPIQIADIDGNGKMDVCLGLIHHDGLLPKDVASVMWMEYTGETPTADNWKFHVIKWGDGADMGHRFRGEKWDNFIFRDVDRDGNLDLLANCEEYTELGVEWLENPLK
jgi:hypothetical protein